uniref:group III truncated hemoglobin n=1 Tax=Pedobacter schmidteae TaxID=2201271 RepID=UPI000EB273B2|nr:group III truncated hemoglobin [Pedobacter schmidteae]
MKDIQDKADITYLVKTFYHTVLTDPLIGPLFRSANFDLESHIPVMVSFWETILFDVITYSGNPMLKHLDLNRTVPLDSTHFERWMNIWTATVNHKFAGPLAEKAILRAQSIAQLMAYKIKQADPKTGL